MDEDVTSGGGLTMQYADDVSSYCTLKTYIILLAKVTTINLLKIVQKSTQIISLHLNSSLLSERPM